MKFDYSRFNPTNLNTQKLKKFMLTKPRLPRIRLSRRQWVLAGLLTAAAVVLLVILLRPKPVSYTHLTLPTN